MKTLDKKAVVITGAGQGLGAAYAKHAAAEGARVVVNDIDAKLVDAVVKAIRDAGGTAVGKVADVASWAEAEGLVQFCVREFGALDGFVNNAALFHMALPEEENEARLRKIVEVNVLGSMFCGLHALRQMYRQGHGSLVNVTSGAQTGISAMGAYGATKGATATMTYAWAIDSAARGVRVNAISPMGQSRMADSTVEYYGARGELKKKRIGIDPERNSPIVSFLLSDAASGINGQVVRIQGTALSLMTHPAVLYPVLNRDTWTVDDVREAFEKTLSARQMPLGVAALEVNVKPYAVPYKD